LEGWRTSLTLDNSIYDAEERIIHIDDDLGETKQNFLKLHETGHHEMPAHRKMFRLFQDCEKTLAPEIADLFEREANNFARYALFQGDTYARMAADHPLEIKTPMRLAKNFSASQYASAREFARTHLQDAQTGRTVPSCLGRLEMRVEEHSRTDRLPAACLPVS
jgi:Zn-dependent peptidase ImmA (M78 family)